VKAAEPVLRVVKSRGQGAGSCKMETSSEPQGQTGGLDERRLRGYSHSEGRGPQRCLAGASDCDESKRGRLDRREARSLS